MNCFLPINLIVVNRFELNSLFDRFIHYFFIPLQFTSFQDAIRAEVGFSVLRVSLVHSLT